MSNEIVQTNENAIQSELVHYTPEELDSRIRETLLEWADSDNTIDPVAKEAIIARMGQLRLKLQTMFLEVQKRMMIDLMIDSEFEGEIRRQMRLDIPFMDATERANTLKALISTYDTKLERLERQMAGFDLFSNVEFALRSLSEVRVPTDLAAKVKELTPAKRRNLLNIIEDLKIEIAKVEDPTPNVEPEPITS